jgi:hypothetical protein
MKCNYLTINKKLPVTGKFTYNFFSSQISLEDQKHECRADLSKNSTKCTVEGRMLLGIRNTDVNVPSQKGIILKAGTLIYGLPW